MNIEKLREEVIRDIKRLNAVLLALSDPSEAKPTTSTRSVTDSTRRKISKSMKKNWSTGKRSAKRKLAPEVKAKIAASQKKRWAAAKAASAAVSAAQPTQVAA